jgi:hypothetical protein
MAKHGLKEEEHKELKALEQGTKIIVQTCKN